MTELHPESTTDDVLGDVDLRGLRFVVTGASSGLGEESARALASRGASVTMAARNPEKNAAAMARIRADQPDADLEQRVLDLADLASVRRFAEDFRADHDVVDVLINNAGVMVCPFGHTTDGFEMQFGTNHLGHFLLTALLADAIVAGERPRVVTLSSAAHLISDVDLDDPAFEHTDYDAWISYGRSKSANALFALELARRMSDRDVVSYSVHPGMVATELARHMTEELMTQMITRISERTENAAAPGAGDSAATSMPAMRAPAVGAATQVWAATAPDLIDASGAYLLDCHVGAGADVADYIRDAERARALWTLSEELVGHAFA
ncbi:MAG: SDR family NAD(P)-dependent oxidoreductase [Acidimicrobiia bacterium]|nr:SDR family NAD(P)-dependent oxidoreductase [Acidimicrobiia bacterium]